MLRERDLYKEDWLGLRWLDERGRLVSESTPGRHMNVTTELLTHVFTEYMSGGKEETYMDEGVAGIEL